MAEDKILSAVDGNTGGGGNGGNTAGNGNTAGTGNTTGTGNTSSNSGPSVAGLDSIMIAITAYLAVSSMVPSYEDVVEIYVDKKMGFDKLEEKAIAANPDEDPAEVKAMVKEERKNMVEYYTKGAGKEDLEKKYNDLKVATTNSLKSIKQLPADVAKAITESVMPPVVGPVAPNPVSAALKVYNHFARIKRIVDTIMVSMLTMLTAIKILGLEKEPWVAQIISPVAGPLSAIQGQLDKKQKEMDEATSDVGDQYKAVDPDGKEITGNQIEDIARDKYQMLGAWPYDKETKKKVKKMIKEKKPYNTEIDGEWGDIFNDYNKWLVDVEKGKVKVSNASAIGNSVETVISGYSLGPNGPSN
jgi:hypothetical protein